MQGEINHTHLEHLKQYGAQVGAAVGAIHLIWSGCLET